MINLLELCGCACVWCVWTQMMVMIVVAAAVALPRTHNSDGPGWGTMRMQT